MRTQALLITLVINVAVASGAEIRSGDLVGEWRGGRSLERTTWGEVARYTFGRDHSFDYLAGDSHGAGKWKLHGGKKLELIYHYDYDPKPISSASPRDWILIDSISKGRVRLRWYSKWTRGALLPPEVWTKRR